MRTSLLKKISVILLVHLLCNRLQAQYTHFQSFMLSADSFYPDQKEAIHLDWRLDLGITAIPLDLSPPYLFTNKIKTAVAREVSGFIWEAMMYHYGGELKV